MKMKTSMIAITVALGALLIPITCHAQTSDDIFKRAQTKFAEEEKNQESWDKGSIELAENAKDALKKEHCFAKENSIVCEMVVLCYRYPELTGETMPDDTEVTAAIKAHDDVGVDDWKNQALSIDRVNVATANYQQEAIRVVDRCATKVRKAYNDAQHNSTKSSAPLKCWKTIPEALCPGEIPNTKFNVPIDEQNKIWEELKAQRTPIKAAITGAPRRNIGCGWWPIGSDADKDCAAKGLY
jgi:hypothetical protein